MAQWCGGYGVYRNPHPVEYALSYIRDEPAAVHTGVYENP